MIHHQGKPRQEGSQGRNLDAGTEAKAMEDMFYWLTLRVTFSLLSHSTQDHMLRCGTAYSGLGAPTSIIIQEKMPPQTCPKSYIMEVTHQLRFALLDDSVCV